MELLHQAFNIFPDLPVTVWLADAVHEPLREDIAAALRRAGAAMRRQDYSIAWREMNYVARLAPRAVFARINRAAALCGVGAFEVALTELDEAEKLSPNNSRVAYGRSVALILGDHVDAAEKAFEALPPDSAELHLCRGILKAIREDIAGAVADFEKARALAPDSPAAYVYGATTLASLQHIPQARVLINKAVDIFPKSFQVAMGRVHVRYMIEDWSGTVEEVERAIHLEPASAHAFHFLSMLATIGDRSLDTALQSAEAAAKLNPTSLIAHLHWATALARQHNPQAFLQVTAAITLGKNQWNETKASVIGNHLAKSYALRARLNFNFGNTRAAILDAERAVEYSTAKAAPLIDLGELLAESGDLQKGLERIESGLAIEPDHAAGQELHVKYLCRAKQHAKALPKALALAANADVNSAQAASGKFLAACVYSSLAQLPDAERPEHPDRDALLAQALGMLEKAGVGGLIVPSKYDAEEFAPLREHPRFVELRGMAESMQRMYYDNLAQGQQ